MLLHLPKPFHSPKTMLIFLDKLPKTINKTEFEASVRSICADPKVQIANPNWLMVCMNAESNMKLVVNSIGAYGFIQITKDTANRDLGITPEALQRLPWQGYMDYVRLYLQKRVKERSSPKSAYELYALIHYPVAFQKPDSYTLYVQGSNAYAGNKALDKNKDGKVQWSEVKTFLDSKTPLFYDKTQLTKPEVASQKQQVISYYYQTYDWKQIGIAITVILFILGLAWWFIPNKIFLTVKNKIKSWHS